MEHHSNIVPWQMLRDAHGIELRVAPITDAGELDMAAFEALLQDGKVGLVAITHMSNVLGTVTPAERIVRIAHAHGAKVLFDGSQAIVHRKVDVQALGCDFYAWTGHKLYGPTGIGVLWGKRELLERMPPFMGGGDMISSVTYEQSTWAAVPHKFEAGTPAILEGIGLKAAIDYVQAIGYDAMAAHEASLTEHALARLADGRGSAHPRPGAGPRRRDLIHHGRGACPRRGDAAGPPGHRGPRRPSLRRTADAPFRPRQHRARQFRHLYDARRNRRAGRRADPRAGVLRMTQTESFDDLRDLYQEVILDHGRKPAARHAAGELRRDRQGRQPDVRRPRPGLGQIRCRQRSIAVGFEARGCAISVASADLMAETVQGRAQG